MAKRAKKQESLDDLISAYCATLDDHLCDPDNDDLRCRLHDCGMELKGRTVAADVKWPNGKISNVTGKVLSAAGEFVYLNVDVGNVEAIANSMSAAE